MARSRDIGSSSGRSRANEYTDYLADLLDVRDEAPKPRRLRRRRGESSGLEARSWRSRCASESRWSPIKTWDRCPVAF